MSPTISLSEDARALLEPYCEGGRFSGLSVEEARRLVELGALDLDFQFDTHPSVADFLELCEMCTGIVLSGLLPLQSGESLLIDTIEGTVSLEDWYSEVRRFVRDATEREHAREGNEIWFRALWE